MSDLTVATDEITRDLKRAKINLEGMRLKKDLPFPDRIRWVVILLDVCLNYLESEDWQDT